jgi:hypothetical protein
MNGILSRTQLNKPGRLTRIILLVSFIVFLAVAAMSSVFQSEKAIERDRASVEAAIEDQYGIHISMLAVTAGGGVVDFRFQITDPEKANFYMHGDYEDLPVLIEEDSGTLIKPREHTHHADYEFGRTYYTIYRNPGGVVKTGSSVTVLLGDLRLSNVIVQ